MSLMRISESIETSIIMIIALLNLSPIGARGLYQSVGFEVKEVRKQMLSGQELTEEQWELVL